MRLLLVLLVLGTCLAAFAQEGEKRSLFQTIRPQASIVVRQHPSGSEIVVVTMVDEKYPKDILRKQAETLAEEMGLQAQGLVVYDDHPSKETPDITLVRAQFGLDGLTDPKTGVYRLQSIARAFAGTPAPNTIEGLAVFFENMPPGPQTLQSYEDQAVAVELSNQSGPIGVEYRIELRSQDPSKIHIPEGRPEKNPVAKPKPRTGTDWTTLIIGGIAALALGTLVYSLLLRARPQSSPPPRG